MAGVGARLLPDREYLHPHSPNGVFGDFFMGRIKHQNERI